MPNFSLAEIASIATQDVGRRADIPLSVVSQRVNMAYAEVANAVPHALLERIAISSTTSGENRIDLPTDFGEPINVSMTWSWSTSASAVSSHKTLTRMNVSEQDASGFLPVGEPTGVAFYNSWIELYPSPDSAYSLQIRYRSMVTDLTALSDVPSISTPWRYAIVLKTEELLHRYLGNIPGAMMANQEYINYCSRTKTDEARRQSGEMRQGFMPVYQTTLGGRGGTRGSSGWTTH